MFPWPRFFLSVLSLAPVCLAQRHASVADCTFTADPDEVLSRTARARRAAYDRVRAVSFRVDQNVAAEAISRRNFIDDEVFGKLVQRGAPSAPLSSDEEFLRRIYLDLTGRIPDPADIRAFLNDSAKDKRDALIDRLLASPEFIDHWTMWMGDWPQNTSTLVAAAANRGTPGRNAFHEYIRDVVTHPDLQWGLCVAHSSS